jgi:hypothetical protein
MCLRLGWDPSHPAIVLALDTRRALHISVAQDHWTAPPEPTRASFVYDPVQQPLPDPVPTEAPAPVLARFQKLLRLDGPNFQTLQSWILAALRPPKDPSFHDYPILNLLGPEAAGKTVAAKLLTHLIDPTGTPLHALPSTERRLHALAASHHLISIDNPGKINPENSRRLARLAGGIASAYRPFEGMLVRPIILTTREERETRHLTSRLVDVEFPPLDAPRPQSEILAEFEALRPELLGAFLTLLSRQIDHPEPCPPNRKEKNQKIEQSVTALINQSDGTWKGTVTDLLQATGLKISRKAMGQFLKEEENHPSFSVLAQHDRKLGRQLTLAWDTRR